MCTLQLNSSVVRFSIIGFNISLCLDGAGSSLSRLKPFISSNIYLGSCVSAKLTDRVLGPLGPPHLTPVDELLRHGTDLVEVWSAIARSIIFLRPNDSIIIDFKLRLSDRRTSVALEADCRVVYAASHLDATSIKLIRYRMRRTVPFTRTSCSTLSDSSGWREISFSNCSMLCRSTSFISWPITECLSYAQTGLVRATPSKYSKFIVSGCSQET